MTEAFAWLETAVAVGASVGAASAGAVADAAGLAAAFGFAGAAGTVAASSPAARAALERPRAPDGRPRRGVRHRRAV